MYYRETRNERRSKALPANDLRISLSEMAGLANEAFGGPDVRAESLARSQG